MTQFEEDRYSSSQNSRIHPAAARLVKELNLHLVQFSFSFLTVFLFSNFAVPVSFLTCSFLFMLPLLRVVLYEIIFSVNFNVTSLSKKH